MRNLFFAAACAGHLTINFPRRQTIRRTPSRTSFLEEAPLLTGIYIPFYYNFFSPSVAAFSPHQLASYGIDFFPRLEEETFLPSNEPGVTIGFSNAVRCLVRLTKRVPSFRT